MTDETYTFSSWELRKLLIYKRAYEDGYFTDELHPGEIAFAVELAEVLPIPEQTPNASLATEFTEFQGS
ncbi:MAG TPA: hypothetical protein VGP82_10575 [Ktedonobacterales bacterium]|jgi:hypothetical protein|nr:hypothetical protein [Ktedonobacterales bacterium]